MNTYDALGYGYLLLAVVCGVFALLWSAWSLMLYAAAFVLIWMVRDR